MSLLPGFVKAQADNLPKMDSYTVFSFLENNSSFMGAEIRGFKTERSGREKYGDNAIGYVQVKRDGDICTVNARVTPEHNVTKKTYTVELQFKEKENEEEILSIQCNDCAASLGGCKHAVALLMWLHRRSEEPAVTSVSSYWKKAKLSCVGSSVKFIKGKDLVKNNLEPLTPLDGSFRKKVVEKSRLLKREDTVLTKYYKMEDEFSALSIHHLLLSFFGSNSGTTADDFIIYATCHMTEPLCLKAMEETVEQSESNLWYQLRYARITASKAHEAAHCHTMEGSLVEAVLGASSLKDTKAMARGRKLEKIVRKEVEKQKNIKIKLCGFATHPDHPIMGASPDGISDNYVIEIKCPSSKKAMTNYIKDGRISEKCNAQLQLQMFFLKKSKGLFCVAAFDFEITKDMSILVVDYDENMCKNIIDKCTTFWKSAVFPLLKSNFE